MASILNELFNDEMKHQQLTELTQPYSRTSSAINRAKSTAKGLVGGGQYEQGAEQAGQLANRFFMQFKRYIGSKYGKKPSYVTYDDVANFMQSQNLNTSLLGTNKNMTFTPKDVAGIFLKAAQEMSSDVGVSQSAPAPAQGPQPQGNNPAAPVPAAQGQGSNTPQDQPAAQGNNSPAPATSGTLASLSPEQRKQLLTILSRL